MKDEDRGAEDEQRACLMRRGKRDRDCKQQGRDSQSDLYRERGEEEMRP